MARRSGGRKARVAIRSAPLADNIKPVHPGETGGQYRPLSDNDVTAIEANMFRILDEIGFADASPHCIDTCVGFGAQLGNDGRLRMPRDVVEKALRLAKRDLVLYGQNPAYDVQIQGQKVHFATAGAAVMIAMPEKNEYRDSCAQDLYDMARIADTCEHIHIFQRMCVLRDIEDNYEMDLNTLYCSIMGTSKHVGASWVDYRHLEKSLELLHIIAGGEAQWRARPFVSQSNCYVVPPMKFTLEALECLRVAVEGGMPVLLLSAACAQFGNHFDLPFGTACGMTDSKLPDFQAGAERASTVLAAALSGANIVYESAGMYASLLGACPESLLLDNDLLGAALRVTRGIEVNEETLGFENIRAVCVDGPGHYLGTDQTLRVMQSDYIYPDYGDRDSPTVWADNGKPVMLENAARKRDEILGSYFPSHISNETDAKLRARFPIFLPPEAIGR